MSYWVTIKTMWACDMGFHSSLRPHVTWDWVTVWAKLGIGVLLVMNTTSSLTFNTPTMDFLLFTLFHGNPTPSNGRPGCPAFSATKNGLVISFSVNFKSGRTADSAKQELVENPALHEGAEFIIVALGGNDLCPGDPFWWPRPAWGSCQQAVRFIYKTVEECQPSGCMYTDNQAWIRPIPSVYDTHYEQQTQAIILR